MSEIVHGTGVLRALATGPDPALLQGRTGRWRWYWVLIGHVVLVALLVAAMVASSIADEWISGLFGRSSGLNEEMYKAGHPETYIAILLVSAGFVLPVVIVMTLVHNQSWRLALGRDGVFDWSDFARAAAAVFVGGLVLTLIEYAFYPERFSVRPHGLWYMPWVLLAALVTVPQAFAEDFLFKGYLTRTWGAILPIRPVIVAASALLFTSLHAGNADVKVDLWFMLVSFVVFDILMVTLYLRRGNLGAVTGLHWMNNVVVLCLITRVPGFQNDLALMEYRDPVLLSGGSHLTSLESWISMVAAYLLTYVLVTWRRSPFHIAHVPVELPALPPRTEGSPPGVEAGGTPVQER